MRMDAQVAMLSETRSLGSHCPRQCRQFLFDSLRYLWFKSIVFLLSCIALGLNCSFDPKMQRNGAHSFRIHTVRHREELQYAAGLTKQAHVRVCVCVLFSF